MNISDSVINESIWVAMGVAGTDGLARFNVYNGGWYGTVDFNNKVFWANDFPAHVIKLKTIRPAVAGECEPYY